MLPAAIAVFALDQLTKSLVERCFADSPRALAGGRISIRYAENTGRGIWQGPWVPLLLWVITVGMIVLAVAYGYLFHTAVARLGLGAALGGAASNLYDRLRRGLIVDFLDLGWWPVFNLADVAITVGVTLAVIFVR